MAIQKGGRKKREERVMEKGREGESRTHISRVLLNPGARQGGADGGFNLSCHSQTTEG